MPSLHDQKNIVLNVAVLLHAGAMFKHVESV